MYVCMYVYIYIYIYIYSRLVFTAALILILLRKVIKPDFKVIYFCRGSILNKLIFIEYVRVLRHDS